MTTSPTETTPTGPAPYAAALIRLLQGIVYVDDREVWEQILRHQSAISAYFAQMGVELYLNENDGFAYLTQPDMEDDAGEIVVLPRLTRRRALTYSVTLVLVLLREELNQFDTTNMESDKLIISSEELFALMRPFYVPKGGDERTLNRQMDHDVNQVVELGFLKKLEVEGQIHFLVRPVLKSRINSDELAKIKEKLETYRHDQSE
ncbi:MAG TPA: DUF4194 domain-containing protein [Aggregatilineales bacterium]|nr:DUF4194 domain-containing protein [Aggregatilineales bacterium]